MFDFNIRPLKYTREMNLPEKIRLTGIDYGGWFDKHSLLIAIYGKHHNLLDYADTINHECLHLIVQEFIGGNEGWFASTQLDHKSMRDVAVLDGVLEITNIMRGYGLHMRKKTPERNMEPPENYDQTICDDCKEEECLLDLICDCPEVQKAERQTHAEFLESKEDNDDKTFGEEFEEYLIKQALQEEPTEDEKALMRRNLIAFNNRKE